MSEPKSRPWDVDLVATLRHDVGNEFGPALDDHLARAADEIERLGAEVEHLTADRDAYAEALMRHAEECEHLLGGDDET